jgi:hypothetical protein
MEFVPTPVWQREGSIALANTGQIRRQVGEAMRDEMHNFAFTLDAAVDADHAG